MKTVRMVQCAVLVFFAVCFMAACGGGGSSAPAGTSTVGVTTGEITGFGSIIVNGIEFSRKTGLPDDRVKLPFDNLSGAREDKLRVGMVVKISGTFNSATGRGEYETIEFQPELRGRLDNAGVDLVNDKIKVMGRDVLIEAATHFDGVRDLAELSADLSGGNHPEVEISGNLDNSGVLHATRISRVKLDFGTNGLVQVKGAIASAPAPTATSFSIGATQINYTSAAFDSGTVQSDIAPGTLLEVKGTLNSGTGIITATRIEKINAVEAELNDNVRIKGVAAGAVSGNIFTLNGPNGGVTVKTASAVFLKGGSAATSAIVTAGARLEVEGSLDASGAIVATKVSIELDKNFRLEGNAAAGAFNATANTLRLNGVTVGIAATTRLEDSSSGSNTSLSLSGIAADDHLQISGIVDAAGTVTASEVKRTKPSSLTFIKGPVTQKTATTLTILGINVDTSSITQASNFVDERTGIKIPGSGTVAQAQAAFFALVTPGSSSVKAKGTIIGTAMAASEVELEQSLQ